MIALVIPCYNESKRLNFSEIKAYSDANPEIHLYFSNDGSSDETNGVISEKLINNTNRYLVDYSVNRGKAETVRDTIYSIHKESKIKYELFAFIDADLAIPFEQLNKMQLHANALKEKMIFITVRTDKEFRQGNDKFRYYISKVWKFFFIKMFFGLKISDTQCGCKMFRSEIVEEVFEEKFISKWLFDIEILFRMLRIQKNSIAEVPIIKLNDNSGSSINNRAILLLLKDVFRIYVRYKIQ